MNNTASCNVAYKVFFFTRKENLVTSKLHFKNGRRLKQRLQTSTE
jgi:hypothetical protein